MANSFYFKKFEKFFIEVTFLYNKSIELQVPIYIIEQIECLGENCLAVIDEIKKFGNQRWQAESFEDLKLDYYFILKLLSHFQYQ